MTGVRDIWKGRARTRRSRVVDGGIVVMGRRQVTPRWVDENGDTSVVGVLGQEGAEPPGRKLVSGKIGRGGSSKNVRTN